MFRSKVIIAAISAITKLQTDIFAALKITKCSHDTQLSRVLWHT